MHFIKYQNNNQSLNVKVRKTKDLDPLSRDSSFFSFAMCVCACVCAHFRCIHSFILFSTFLPVISFVFLSFGSSSIDGTKSKPFASVTINWFGDFFFFRSLVYSLYCLPFGLRFLSYFFFFEFQTIFHFSCRSK